MEAEAAGLSAHWKNRKSALYCVAVYCVFCSVSAMRLRTVVAQNLRRMRHKKGMSQEELAAQAGLYRTYVGHLEREVHSPTVDMLEKLAEILDVAPTDFFTDPPPPIPAAPPRKRKRS